MVKTEFSFPGGQIGQKELPANHKDLRRASFESWSPHERALYQRWFDSLGGGAGSSRPCQEVANFLTRSGLGRAALLQVWTVANPANAADLDCDSFFRCCRLVAHCQELGVDTPVVATGERPLRVKL